MKTKRTMTATAFCALVAASSALIGPSYAETSKAPASTAQTTQTSQTKTMDKQGQTGGTAATTTASNGTTASKGDGTQQKAGQAQAIRTMAEAYDAMQSVHAARLAIFNGDTDSATKMVTQAKSDFDTASKSASQYAVQSSKSSAGNKETYLPFDSSISLVEGYMPSAEKQPAIDQANQHLAKGDSQKAVETLKDANVEVTVSAALIPLDKSMSNIGDAQKLMSDGKYYEANLALKAVEDLIFVDAYSVDGMPVHKS